MAKWFGVNFPFYGTNTVLGSPQKVAGRQEDFRLIRNDLIQSILTLKNERVFRPQFGGDIHRSLFEMNDDATRIDLEQKIRIQINRFHPRIILSDVIVETDDENENIMKVKILGRTNLDSTNTDNVLAEFQFPRSGSLRQSYSGGRNG